MYFSQFPVIYYDAVGNSNPKVVTHLLKRVALHSKASETVALFDTYDVRNGETPEMIAHKYYDDAEYHWVILLVNNITDRYHQWPTNTRQFLSHLAERYDNVNAVHHYEIYQESGDTSVKINIGTSNVDVDGIRLQLQHLSQTENTKRKSRTYSGRYDCWTQNIWNSL